ncbi:MAG: hypothetical protein PSV36_00930 [Algoriphagus sp.]|nr:hypothetical protein [Algoriphagus sp.]
MKTESKNHRWFCFKSSSIFIFCAILIPFISFAQAQKDSIEVPKESFFGIAIGLRPQSIRDQLVTEMKYSGSPFYLNINHIKTKKQTVRSLNIESSIGSLKTNSFEIGKSNSRFIQPSFDQYWNEISYSHLFQIHSGKAGKLYLGPVISHTINLRLSTRWDNSQINYDISGLLIGEVAYQREFNFWKKSMKFQGSLRLPLVGYLLRPPYSGVPDFLDHEKDLLTDIFSNNYAVWMGDFPKTQFRSLVEFPIASGNKMQIVYNWEYYSFQNPNSVQSGAHTLAVNFLLKAK